MAELGMSGTDLDLRASPECGWWCQHASRKDIQLESNTIWLQLQKYCIIKAL